MKKLWCIITLMCLTCLSGVAQNVVYPSLKMLLAQKGDTIAHLKVEKRSKNNILMSGGADYRITAGNDDALCKYLKKRCYAVTVDSAIYINCKKLRYKRLRFGGWFAPAMRLGNAIYFSAIPLGTVAAGDNATMDVMLGGALGDALAASALITKRVYYRIEGETGKVDFVGKEMMMELLAGYPEWKAEYLQENSESAKVTDRYLRLLQSVEK